MRYLGPFIKQDLQEKMVFVSGPRQVGKTTLALDILGGDSSHPAYFNWDNFQDQKKLIQYQLPIDEKLIVLDEIHKYKKWRNWLKGLYDKTKNTHQYLITGSARLDIYRHGGDSLTGRYHPYRLHPLSLGEVDKEYNAKTVGDLLQFSGFPDPFYKQSTRSLKRWQQERLHQVLKEDIRDLERVHDIDRMLLLVHHIPNLVGSPLSINALREDLQVNHVTVQKWILIFEKLYFSFRLYPYGAKKIRAVKKEAKAYLWDWTLIGNPGVRFENFVACQLLKYCHFVQDTEGDSMDLRYLRDTDKREVDFIVLKNNKPLFAVECKLSEKSVSPHIFYFAQRLEIPAWYQVHMDTNEYKHALHPIWVIPFHRFAKKLRLP